MSSEVNDSYMAIVDQYFENASFLWHLRSVALDQPHYSLEDIGELESRIAANLDGLLAMPDQAWPICEEGLDLQEAGETFSAAVVAFVSLEQSKIQKVVSAGVENEQTFEGLLAAMTWLPENLVWSWVEKLLRSKDLNHKRLAVAVYAEKRKDPADYLTKLLARDDCVAHPGLHGQCLRLIGEIKRRDLLPALKEGCNADEDSVCFWALRSTVLLGDNTALAKLETYIDHSSPFSDSAIEIYVRAAPVASSRQLISRLASDDKNIRLAIHCSAALGDPQAITWLLHMMNQAKFSRVAAEAFTTITGIHLEQNNLSLELPKIADPVPNNDPEDEGVDMDVDENLPWPDTEKLKAVWQTYGQQYQVGRRYFLGRPIEVAHLQNCLKDGCQRHRHAAAMEIGLLMPAQSLINTRERVLA